MESTSRTIVFELTMPNNNSWNGVWTGRNKRYFIFKLMGKKKDREAFLAKIGDKRNFYYNFGDGWGANVKVSFEVPSAEIKSFRKINAGFCGYDWMVDEILEHGRILTRDER